MSRSVASTIALCVLVAFSAATWWLAEGSAGPDLLLAVAVAKVGVIGGVFLELDRAWPGWTALFCALVLAIAGGVVLLV